MATDPNDYTPDFAKLDSVKRDTVLAFASLTQRAKLNPFEMIATIIAVVTDIVTGAATGMILGESLGLLPRAKADEHLAGLKELYAELSELDREFLLDMLQAAIERHEPGNADRFEAKLKAAGRGTARESLSRIEFERMMRGTKES